MIIMGSISLTIPLKTHNYGIYIFDNSTENTISFNTINTSGTATDDGIRVESASNNNTFDANIITTSGGTSSYGIHVISSNNSFFNNTLLDLPVEWIVSDTVAENNNFSNTSRTDFFYK